MEVPVPARIPKIEQEPLPWNVYQYVPPNYRDEAMTRLLGFLGRSKILCANFHQQTPWLKADFLVKGEKYQTLLLYPDIHEYGSLTMDPRTQGKGFSKMRIYWPKI